MTVSNARRRLRPDSVLCADSLERALLDAAAPDGPEAVDGLRHVPVLGRRGELPEELRRPALAAEACNAAVPLDAVDEIDAEAVAEWIVRRYPGSRYPAVVLGSPHGSAVHLAAALGAAWLPTTFTVRVPWPGGSVGGWTRAADWGARLTDRILAGNRSVTVRQVHDPLLAGPLCSATVTLHLQWQQLPAAYDRFLRTCLAPGGMSLALRDVRTWPVIELGPGYTMQVGSPVTGLSPHEYDAELPALRSALVALGADVWCRPHHDTPPRYAERAGEPGLEPQLRQIAAESGHRAHRVLYRGPGTLSACVADLYREHLRGTTGQGETCLIETGRLLDPRGVLERGLVPYWCESAAERTVAAAEWWLAGSDRFERVAVLPEPPGTPGGTHAPLIQWRSLAGFAGRAGWVDRQVAGRYPRLPLPRSNALRVANDSAEPAARIAPMTAAQVVEGIRRNGVLHGMFIS
jgi:hypothetical protein